MTRRPSLSPVIRKPISTKFLKKTNQTQITKPTNTFSTQSTLYRRTNNTPTFTTSIHTLCTLTSSSSAPPPSVTLRIEISTTQKYIQIKPHKTLLIITLPRQLMITLPALNRHLFSI